MGKINLHNVDEQTRIDDKIQIVLENQSLSMNQIIQKTKIGRRTLYRHMAQLTKLGFILKSTNYNQDSMRIETLFSRNPEISAFALVISDVDEKDNPTPHSELGYLSVPYPYILRNSDGSFSTKSDLSEKPM